MKITIGYPALPEGITATADNLQEASGILGNLNPRKWWGVDWARGAQPPTVPGGRRSGRTHRMLLRALGSDARKVLVVAPTYEDARRLCTRAKEMEAKLGAPPSLSTKTSFTRAWATPGAQSYAFTYLDLESQYDGTWDRYYDHMIEKYHIWRDA